MGGWGHEPWDSVEFTSAHAFGLSPEDLGERVLATILFSDIFGSTEVIERVGDRAWAALLREHNARIRAAIDRFQGREIDSAGDGFLALFDGAAKAVRAAELMDPSVSDLGLRVRVGIHTSEVEIVGGRARPAIQLDLTGVEAQLSPVVPWYCLALSSGASAGPQRRCGPPMSVYPLSSRTE